MQPLVWGEAGRGVLCVFYVMSFCYLFVLYLPPSSLIAQCLSEELLDFRMLYDQDVSSQAAIVIVDIGQ